MIAVRVLIAVTAVALLFLSISPATTFVHAEPRNTTLYNDRPRFDVDGQYVDAHDGMILAHTFPNASTVYFLYGEFYNTTRGGAFPWGRYPQMSVYTSEDMSTWSYRGQAVDESYSSSSKWIPNVIYDKQLKRFVMWFGCGQWCVATSEDGLVFSNVTLQYSRYGDSDSTDGTGVFIDDDGSGYIIFSSPNHNHSVSIELLSPDLLSSTKKLVATLPDIMVESPSLFRRNGIYYATYGSCCCACRAGSGQVVNWATSPYGPWTRQYPNPDINCVSSEAQVCGEYHGHADELVWHAQWWGPSFIPLANGETAVLFMGRRWLSGPNNPAACPRMCTQGQECDAPQYFLRSDYDVWLPLQFSPDGHVLRMQKLQEFVLQLP